MVRRTPSELELDDGSGVLLVDGRSYLRNKPSAVDVWPQSGKTRSSHEKALRSCANELMSKNLVLGSYVMLIGPLRAAKASANGSGRPACVVAHQVIPLDAHPQRESVWFLEVVEYWRSVMAAAQPS